jgi:hypothetical protein
MYCYVSSIFSSFILAVVSRYGSTIKKEEDYKQTAPETLQRSQTHRQTKSIYRRNNRDIRVVNNEDRNCNNDEATLMNNYNQYRQVYLQLIMPCWLEKS